MILRRALSAGSLIKTGRGDTIKFYERSRFRDHFPAKIVKLFSKVPNTAATWLGDWRWHSPRWPALPWSRPASSAGPAGGVESW